MNVVVSEAGDGIGRRTMLFDDSICSFSFLRRSSLLRKAAAASAFVRWRLMKIRSLTIRLSEFLRFRATFIIPSTSSLDSIQTRRGCVLPSIGFPKRTVERSLGRYRTRVRTIHKLIDVGSKFADIGSPVTTMLFER